MPLIRCLAAIGIVLSLFSHVLSDWANTDFKSGNLRGYTEIRADLINDFIQVPASSVIFCEWGIEASYINFIRPDLLMVSPTWPLPLNQTFPLLVEQYEHVYVYAISDWVDVQKYEQLYPVLSQYRDSNKKLVKIK
jgi:hypothetical protein